MALNFDAGASAYDRFMGRWSRLYLPALLASAEVTGGQRVLDVATGTGEAALMAASLVGQTGRVVGVDISLPMLRQARARSAGTPITLAVGDALALPFRDGAFEAVICQLGLMLVPDPRRAAREFRRVLRPRGRVAVCVWSTADRMPLIGLLAAALSRHLPALRDVLFQGCSLGEAGRLEQLLVGAGFRDVHVTRDTRELVFGSAEDFWAPVEAGGARLGQAYRELPAEARRAVFEEVRARVTAFESRGRIVMEAEALCGVASG